MGTGIKGFKSQKMLKSKLKGYTDDQSIDPERYVTIQEIPGDRYAADVMIHGAYKVNLLGVLTVAAGSNVRVIKCTAHGAQKGDFVKFVSDATEVQVLSAPDANTIILATELSFDPTGLTFDVLRGVTPSYNKDGSMNVLSAQGPVQYRDASTGLPQETTLDPSTPSSNRPLPTGLMIKKDDGNYYPVTLDTTNPYAHTPIPVAITDVTGTANVNITAGDVNVSIKHNGADPSSVRIGDGTNLAAVTAANELKVSNPVLNVDTASSGTITGSSSVQITTTNYGCVAFTVAGTWTGTITVELSQDNSTWYTTSYVSLASGNVSSTFTANTSGQVNVVGYAYFRLKGATVATGTAIINIIASNKVGTVNMDHPLPAGSNNIGNINNITGTVSLPTGAATSALQTTGNNSLSSIDTKIPGLGQALMAASIPVVIASNQSAIPVTGTFYQATQPISGTVAVSNFPTTVDTNTGAATANTIRNVLATRHETNTTPLALRESDGTNWLSSIALAAAQLTSGALTAIRMGACIVMGWDGTTHRELAVGTDGSLKTSETISSGTISTAQKTVGLTAVRATVSGSAPSSTRKKLWIKPSKNNLGAIYIGSSSATISTAMEIIGPDRWEVINDANDYYLISDTAGQVVEVLEIV